MFTMIHPLPDQTTMRKRIRDELTNFTVSPHVNIPELVAEFSENFYPKFFDGSDTKTVRYGSLPGNAFQDYLVAFTILNPAQEQMIGISTINRGMRGSGMYFPMTAQPGSQMLACINHTLSWFHRETDVTRKLMALREKATALNTELTTYRWYASTQGV